MRKLTRRELLKVSLGTMGALALANLPNWHKPALRVGVLPAHAQASLGTGDLQATLTWNTGEIEPEPRGEKIEVDMDLYVEEPDGTLVGYYGVDEGTTAIWDVDNQWGFGPENIFVAAGAHANGVYYIGVDPYYNPVDTTCTIRVTVFAGTANEEVRTFTKFFEAELEGKATIGPGDALLEYAYPVAKVTFPAGTIEEWNVTKGMKLVRNKTK